jgi:hypothetical protein
LDLTPRLDQCCTSTAQDETAARQGSNCFAIAMTDQAIQINLFYDLFLLLFFLDHFFFFFFLPLFLLALYIFYSLLFLKLVYFFDPIVVGGFFFFSSSSFDRAAPALGGFFA